MSDNECQGKDSWPELVGVEGKVAAATIERENPLVNANIVLEGTSVTDDFRCDRVRVWVDKSGIVIQLYAMDNAFDMVGSVSPGRESWRFKVLVLRLWNVYSFMRPDQVNSIEMVLIDEKGAKIHASVRRQLMYLFRLKIAEGNVYKMSHFSVEPEPDPYGLSLSTIGDICGFGPEHDFLVDVIALITGISAEKEYIRDGRVTKMIVLELSDNSGKCECTLFGDYVEELQRMLSRRDEGLPVVVVQFAKIKIFRGNVSLQNVMSATRIYVNPSIPEFFSFKKGLTIRGVETSSSIPVIGPHVRPSLEEEFLVNYPKTSIAQLLENVEDGIYVVGAVVDGLVEFEEWWYPACSCHRCVTADSGAFYCKQCVKHVFKMVPRFRVKLKVDDGSGHAVFVVFDNDMIALLGIPCHELVASSKVVAQNAGFYPTQLELLKGTKLLFKVEKSSDGSMPFDGSFRVKRICDDISVINTFYSALGISDDVEVNVEEEFVESTQVDDFVTNLIVNNVGEENAVSPKSVLSEVISLGDDSDSGIEVFVLGRVELQADKYSSAKRNLLAAFSESDDASPSSSKIKKVSGK
ncbi:hypothetical protein TSUD_63630 [Trifolium subterraneum]|uniref:Uncharacterized protein n=1 Tax=Trifolium subterraneum TaxID=3900 RepID=A0A2Z6MGD9_TRISU|nr:hypothetical protein TSUD_63630 [Trifolium subterraneum]